MRNGARDCDETASFGFGPHLLDERRQRGDLVGVAGEVQMRERREHRRRVIAADLVGAESSRPSRMNRSSTSTLRPSASLTRWPAKLRKLGARPGVLACRWHAAQPSLTISGAPCEISFCSGVNGSLT